MSDREAKEAREVEQGYQESSLREVRLREWWSSRDDPRKDKAFASLVESLRARRWFLEIRKEGGSRYERFKTRQRAYQTKTGRPRSVARRATQLRSTVVACACGVQWCPVPGAKGRLPRWCSAACKDHYLKRPKRRWLTGGVLSCRACGAEYMPVPWASGRQPKYCSDACRRAGEANARRRTPR